MGMKLADLPREKEERKDGVVCESERAVCEGVGTQERRSNGYY